MNIIIQKAKNGEDTALAENLFLHSNYAPSREAERFVENLNIPYTPSSIIITEPGLSYIAAPLKKKYPDIKLGAIRYTEDFSSFNKSFDFIINYFEIQNLENYLLSKYNEEELLSIFFLSWQPSSKAFADTDKACWTSIKNTLERAKTLLVTRQYFEKKWIINTFNFLKYIKKPVIYSKEGLSSIKKDILIIASGPSLNDSINIIKEKADSFFIICLSSAISACFKNNIIPDLCFSTDGGYWAGEHFKKINRHNIVLALPSEGYCKKYLLENNFILPLNYDDGISKILIEESGLEYLHAERNGTVTGTALKFAIQYFNSNIYLCGVDLASNKGLQHIQPNELEINNCLKDNRINTKEKRNSAAEFSGDSLKIYLEWFQSQNFNFQDKKIYRVINENRRKNTLGSIIDINSKEFSEAIKNSTIASIKKTNEFLTIQKTKIDIEKIFNNFEKECVEKNFKKLLFPLDFVSLSHNLENSDIKEKIEERYNNLIQKIRKIIYD